MIRVIIFLFSICFLINSLLSQHSHRLTPEDLPYSSAFQSLLDGTSIDEILNHQKKCGFPLMAEIYRNWDKLSPQQKDMLQMQFQIPSLQTSMISPEGYFRVHYDTTGFHAPDLTDTGGNGIPDYIDSVATIFDYVLEYYRDVLTYELPESYGEIDPATGDIIRYNVFVMNIPGGYYGRTAWFGNPTDKGTAAPTYHTWIEMRNSYDGFFTEGYEALRVTAAHEFHHAIQIGSYGLWSAEIFFYEITSTWLEDVMYPDVNDYYNYLQHIFRANVYRFPFYSSTGLHMYARAIWGHMMERRYGIDIMRMKWEHIKQMSPLEAIHQTLFEHGSSYERELAEFHLWKFYTGARARPERYFLDGANYPMLEPKLVTAPFMQEATIQGHNIASQTLHYYAFVTEQYDSIYVLISNVDPDPQVRDGEFALSIRAQSTNASMLNKENINYRLYADNLTHWKVISIAPDIKIVEEGILLYPNPFRIPHISSVSIVVGNDFEDVQLSIFSGDMRLIYQGDLTPLLEFDKPVVRWDGRTDDGRLVGSGMYIYVLRQGNTILRGKFTVVRN